MYLPFLSNIFLIKKLEKNHSTIHTILIILSELILIIIFVRFIEPLIIKLLSNYY